MLAARGLLPERVRQEDLEAVDARVPELEYDDLERSGGMAVQELDGPLQVLGDLVDREDEAERSLRQVGRDPSPELLEVELRLVGDRELDERRTGASTDRRVEVVVRHPPKPSGVTEQLTDDGASDLRVAVELGLDERDPTIEVDEENVEVPGSTQGELPERDDRLGSPDEVRRFRDQFL
jgi:hypothetical protein